MLDIAKEIKRIQQESEQAKKEAKYYKDRYESLRDEIKSLTEGLINLIGEKPITISPKRGPKGPRLEVNVKWKNMKDELLKEMIVDGKDIYTDRLTEILEANEIEGSPSNKTKLRRLLFEHKGIITRQDERDKISKVLYYDKNIIIEDKIKTMLIQKFGATVKEIKPKTDVGEIKIEPISFMR